MEERGHQAGRKPTGERIWVGLAVESEREEQVGGEGRQAPSGSRRVRGKERGGGQPPMRRAGERTRGRGA